MKNGVAVFPFGSLPQNRSNIILGRIASKWAETNNAEVITQQKIIIRKGVETTYIDYPNPSTIRISYEVVDWIKARNIENLCIVAANPHIARCMRDLQYLFIKTRYYPKIICPEELGDYPEYIWFQNKTSEKKWKIRESILLNFPIEIYEFITF